MNHARATILARRARFFRAALAGAAVALEGCEATNESVCLAVPFTCEASLVVAPERAEVCTGGLQQFVWATGSRAGSPTPSSGVTWKSSNPSIVTIDPKNGNAVAHAPGRVTITATACTEATATMTVRDCDDGGDAGPDASDADAGDSSDVDASLDASSDAIVDASDAGGG